MIETIGVNEMAQPNTKRKQQKTTIEEVNILVSQEAKANPIESEVSQIEKQIIYSPLRSALIKIIRGANGLPDYAQMLRFNNSYVKLLFEENGNFYLRAYEANGTQIRWRDGYGWGNLNFCTQNRVILEYVANQVSKLEPNQINSYVMSLLTQISNSLRKHFNKLFNNTERYNTMRQFVTDIYDLIIFPNAEVFKANLNKENSAINVDNIWFFSILSEEKFLNVINFFVIQDCRVISSLYLFHNEAGDIFNFDLLASHYKGWDDISILKVFVSRPNLLNSSNFSKIVAKFDVSKLHSFFIENHKYFVKNQTVSFFAYYINVLCGGVTLESLVPIAKVLSNTYSYEELESEGVKIKEFIENNPDEILKPEVFNILVDTRIDVAIPENKKMDILKAFVKGTDSRNLFERFINTKIGFDNFLNMFPAIFEHKNTYEKINNNQFLNCIGKLSNDEFIQFVNRLAVPFNKATFEYNNNFFGLIVTYTRTTKEDIPTNAIVGVLKENGWLEEPLMIFDQSKRKVKLTDFGYSLYMRLFVCAKGYWNVFDKTFDFSDLKFSSQGHKMFFNKFVDAIDTMEREEIYVKHFFDLRKHNPIHAFLDRLINFYSIEDGVKNSLTTEDYLDNQEVWKKIIVLFKFFENYLSIQYLKLHDDQNLSVKNKIKALDPFLHLGTNNVPALDITEYCADETSTLTSKIMFWKKEVKEVKKFDYLYISPQGPLLSNEIIPSFIDIVGSDENWKDKHNELTKNVYALLQVGQVPTEISIQVRELVRNFKQIAENLEPIKDKLDFEEQMFFEQSFFNDLINMLQAHNNGVGNLKIMNSISAENHQELIIKSQENCQRIMNMLQKQMDNISNDIFNNLVSKSNFDLEVLAEYVKSRNFGKGEIT